MKKLKLRENKKKSETNKKKGVPLVVTYNPILNGRSKTDTFSSTVTGESFEINQKFNCNNKGLVYLITFRSR